MTRLVIVAACAVAALVPAAAQAAAPPKGVYDCRYRVDDGPAGNIRIASRNTYRYSGRKLGMFTTSRRTISFTTGVMRGVYEHSAWRRSGRNTFISLYDGDTPGESPTDARCRRRRG